MKKLIFPFSNFFVAIIGFCLSMMLLTSCATDFEKVRTSNDPKLILVKANEYYQDKEWLSAQTLYELAIQFYRGKAEAEMIYFNYANTYYQLGEYITASHYFKTFASTYSNSTKREEAAFMSAYSEYKLSPNARLDQSYSKKAIENFQDFINNNPQSTRVQECNALIDEMRTKLELKAYEQGVLYFEIGQYQSAVRSFELMLKEFPNAVQEEKARFLMLKSSFELAKNSVIDKRKERYEDTVALAKKSKDKFKNASFTSEATDILNKSLSQINK